MEDGSQRGTWFVPPTKAGIFLTQLSGPGELGYRAQTPELNRVTAFALAGKFRWPKVHKFCESSQNAHSTSQSQCYSASGTPNLEIAMYCVEVYVRKL